MNQEPGQEYNLAKQAFVGPENREGDAEGWDEIVQMKLEELRTAHDGNEEKALAALSAWYLDLIAQHPDLAAQLREAVLETDRQLAEKFAKQQQDLSPRPEDEGRSERIE